MSWGHYRRSRGRSKVVNLMARSKQSEFDGTRHGLFRQTSSTIDTERRKQIAQVAFVCKKSHRVQRFQLQGIYFNAMAGPMGHQLFPDRRYPACGCMQHVHSETNRRTCGPRLIVFHTGVFVGGVSADQNGLGNHYPVRAVKFAFDPKRNP